MKSVPAFAAAFALAAAYPVTAQTAGDAQTASDAPAAAAPTPICTDRPTKSNVICTVPAGSVQIETDLVNWTRNTDAGVRTDLVYYTNPYFKYGLGPRTDLEVNIAPYVTARTSAGGAHDTIGGVGDLYVRVKQQIVGSGNVQVALIPYVKAPTARFGIGNKRWEGGVIVPVVFALPAGLTLNFGPEVDALADADRHGRHAQLVSLANLSKSFGKATLYVEFWNAQNFDPSGTIHQYSADVAAAYLLGPTLQLDAGANFGLNRYTADAQVYVGVSTRF